MLISRVTIQPTVGDLVALALACGDFIADLAPHADLDCLAHEYAERGADTWEDHADAQPGTVAPALIAAARDVLLALADDLLRRAERDALDARADAFAAGDIDHAGHPVPYAPYRSA